MRPPFDLADARLFTAADALVTFADRYRTAAPVRPARYERATMWLIRIEPAGCRTRSPLAGDGCRENRRPPSRERPVPHLIELSIMPFLVGDMLRSMPGGVPTFYLGYEGVPYPADHTGVRPSDPVIPLQGAWLGILFQDRMTLAPWAWFDRLAPVPGADPGWGQWAGAYAGRRRLRLLDAQGRPYPGQTIRITDGSQVASGISDAAGEVDGVALHGALSWERTPAVPGPTLPVMALLDTSTEQPSRRQPAGYSGRSQRWAPAAHGFGRLVRPYLHEDPESDEPGARFRTRSLMEPLVDGEETFARLMTDLRAAIGVGGAAYFAGWSFKDFPFEPPDEATRLVNLAKTIEDEHGQVKVLAAKFLQASDQALDMLAADAGMVLLILLGVGGQVAAVTTKSPGTPATLGFGIWVLLTAGGLVLYHLMLADGEPVGKALGKVAEQTSPDFLAG